MTKQEEIAYLAKINAREVTNNILIALREGFIPPSYKAWFDYLPEEKMLKNLNKAKKLMEPMDTWEGYVAGTRIIVRNSNDDWWLGRGHIRGCVPDELFDYIKFFMKDYPHGYRTYPKVEATKKGSGKDDKN